MEHVTLNTAQKDFTALFNDVARYKEPVTVVSDNREAVIMLSMDEWHNIQETLYLYSVPGMVDSIKAAAFESLTDGVSADEVDFDV